MDTGGDVSPAPEAMEEITNRRRRLIRTCCMVLIYVCLGLYAGIVTPALLDLAELVTGEANTEKIARALMMKAIGLLVGSIVGGPLSDRFRSKSDLILGVAGVITAVSTASAPWCPNLVLMGTVYFIQGFLQAVMNIVCSSATIIEWGERSAVAVNALHTGYTLGMLLAPPTTSPFISHRSNSDANDTDTMRTLTVAFDSPGRVPGGHDSPNVLAVMGMEPESATSSNTSSFHTMVYVPYAAYSVFGVLISIIFLVFFCLGWEYKPSSTEADKPHAATGEGTPSATTRGGLDRFYVVMVISLFVCYVGLVTRDNSLNLYIFAICLKSRLRMSTSLATILNTTYNGSWLVGRVLGTLLARCVSIEVLVIGGTILALIDFILLTWFGLSSVGTFWALSCALGVIGGPSYASTMAWTDRYIRVSGVVVAFIEVGIGVGGFFSSWMGGFLLQEFGAWFVIIQGLAGAGLFVLVIVPLQIVASRKGARFSETDNRISTEQPLSRPDDMDESSPLIN